MGDNLSMEDEWLPVDMKQLRRNSSIEDLPMPDVARVLVLYTGGTIGMKRDARGVYCPTPHLLEESIKKFPPLHDPDYVAERFTDRLQAPLVLPDCREERRVIYSIYEYNPLLDSSNMTMDDWIRIATDIKIFYNRVDGFVILHGTDTMSYTASALSFMLENLGKPVIITGAQIPIFEPRSDGRDNLLEALILAGNYTIPEVALFFNHQLFRGNRTTKLSAYELDAFHSPNLSALVKIGIGIEVDWKLVYRSTEIAKFNVHPKLNKNVSLLRLFPSITCETVRAFLRPPVEGVVLQTYGAGNAPCNRPDVLQELNAATDSGIIIINITQCNRGTVDPAYETGKCLSDIGVIPGFDMTPEAALTKLSYVLAKDWSLEMKKKMLMSNLRGELTLSQSKTLSNLHLITAISRAMGLSTEQEVDTIKNILFPSILCAAAKAGDIQNMELLQQHGGDVTAANYDHRTPLHVAASEGQEETVQYLLSLGANVHERDRNGNTPLLDAILSNQHAVIKLLRSAGAHLYIDNNAFGEMLCSAASISNLDRLKAFHLAGVDLDTSDITGRTALHIAVLVGSELCVTFLLKHGANPHLEDSLGNSAISIAHQCQLFHLEKILKQANGFSFTSNGVADVK